jgi:hypothetical protein
MRFDLRGRGPLFVLGLLLACWAAGAGTPGFTLPMYAARTGNECRACHFDHNGGGPRNSLGYLFERQRHDLTPDPDTTWAQIPSTNRIGDAVYLGTNTRLLYLYSKQAGSNATDLSSFFQMQGALDVTLQPHPNLSIVMVRDFGEYSGDITRDLYGQIQDSGGRFYARAGRIRGVFGLRQDDHQSALRGGFLNAAAGGTGGFLPYDPHAVESGIEAGIHQGSMGLSASLQNGGAAFVNRAQAVAGKFVTSVPSGRIGLSIYDRFATSTRERATRWSGYGLFRTPGLSDLTWIGEVGYGTDDLGNGVRHNLVASFAEADYRLSRRILLRAKYDYSDVFRSSPGNASERYVLETDLTLVPFADLKLGVWSIVPETTDNELRVIGMVHLYY